MVTLIVVGNSDGIVGRCDAKCYNARGPDCDCICGGRNHGAGLEQAQDNVCEEFLGERNLAAFCEKRGLDPRVLEVATRKKLVQQELFS